MMPSCVSFRDQMVKPDTRRIGYKGWTELFTYINNMAAKDAIRETMDSFEPHLKDGLPIAKELYRRGVISKHAVDMNDAAQFASIPSYTHNHNAFFSSAARALDDTFDNWYQLLDILRAYPELHQCIDAMEQKYREKLVLLEAEKYRVNPPLVSSEEAKVLFDELCDSFEVLWNEITTRIRNQTTLEDLKSHLRYVFLDQREQMDAMTTMDDVFDQVRTRMDLTNCLLLESMMAEYEWHDLRVKVVSFMRQRAIKCSRICISDFVNQISTNPKYKFPNPGMGATFRLGVNWSRENKSAFYYFWLIEIVFSSLTKHQYLCRMSAGLDQEEEDGDASCSFIFYYATPDWVTPSILKVSRERGSSLKLNGVIFCSVLNEMTVINPDWDLSIDDYFSYMNSVVRLSRGDMDGVVDTLDGLDPRKKWISDDVDKKYNSYDQLNDDYPRAVQWLPKTITFSSFFSFYESNHVWISQPFYTDRKGFKFALCVYPRGKDSGRGTHMSVGVVLMAGEQDDMLKFPVNGKIYVRLLNQLGDHSHVQGVYDFNESSRPEVINQVQGGGDFAPLGLSIDEFLSLSDLDYNEETGTQYLIYERLYFQVMQTGFVHRYVFE